MRLFAFEHQCHFPLTFIDIISYIPFQIGILPRTGAYSLLPSAAKQIFSNNQWSAFIRYSRSLNRANQRLMWWPSAICPVSSCWLGFTFGEKMWTSRRVDSERELVLALVLVQLRKRLHCWQTRENGTQSVMMSTASHMPNAKWRWACHKEKWQKQTVQQHLTELSIRLWKTDWIGLGWWCGVERYRFVLRRWSGSLGLSVD